MTRTLIVLSTLLIVICVSSAQAEGSTVVTLSCDGALTDRLRVTIIVDLAAKTLTFDGRLFSIHLANVDYVAFGGRTPRLAGIIDRTTGKTDVQDQTAGMDLGYDLVCKVRTPNVLRYARQ